MQGKIAVLVGLCVCACLVTGSATAAVNFHDSCLRHYSDAIIQAFDSCASQQMQPNTADKRHTFLVKRHTFLVKRSGENDEEEEQLAAGVEGFARVCCTFGCSLSEIRQFLCE